MRSFSLENPPMKSSQRTPSPSVNFTKVSPATKKCFENTNPFIGFLLFFLKKVKKPFLGPKISCVHFAAFVDISLGERANYWPIWAANGCSSNLHGQQKKRGAKENPRKCRNQRIYSADEGHENRNRIG